MPGVERLRRIAWNGMAIVSAMLCLALAGLWIRSYSVRDMYRWFARRDDSVGTTICFNIVRAVDGEVGFVHFEQTYGPGPLPAEYSSPDEMWRDVQRHRGWTTAPPRESIAYWEPSSLGFQYHDDPSSISGAAVTVRDRLRVIPYWFMVTATGLIPAWWLCRAIRVRVRRRRNRWACTSCGYDCRATPERCPECDASEPMEPR